MQGKILEIKSNNTSAACQQRGSVFLVSLTCGKLIIHFALGTLQIRIELIQAMCSLRSSPPDQMIKCEVPQSAGLKLL